MKVLSRILAPVWACMMILGSICPAFAQTEGARVIELKTEKTNEGYTHSALLDGQAVESYDYTWHIDPAKKEPEYYTGTKPTEDAGVYIAHDIFYYPLLEESKFKKVSYDGEMEWVYFYEAKGLEKYIFSTLPAMKSGFPSQMMHSAEEAYENAVLHINEPGTYELKGTWHGQIRIDLAEESFADPTQKVTLILNGAEIECTVASGIVFAETYECDNQWEEAESHSATVETSAAGANILIADGSANSVSGTNIFRLLKAKYKDDESTDAYPAQKKLLKVDGALYSYRSLNIGGGEKGNGILNITSGFEGMGSELHLTVNGGNVNVYSQDDGINVNEDGVSVLTVNGGNLHIAAGLGDEGDGIDSNGYLVINGGSVIASANPAADSGMDSDCGSYVNGGTVVALGSAMDWAKAADAKATQAIMNIRFGESQNADEAIVITDSKDQVVFAYDPEKDEVMGEIQRTYSGAILSAKALQVGKTYRLYVGGDVAGEEKAGIYDPETVTKFSDATRQCYSGTAVGGHEGMDEGPRKPQNEGMAFPHRQENTGIALPGGQAPQEGEGKTPPTWNDGEQPSQPPADFGQGQVMAGATCTFTDEFALSEAVNAFGSVTDYRHDLQKQEKGYFCSACGNTFADAQGQKLLSDGSNSGWISVLIYAVVFLAGAATATAVFAILLLLKKRKN